MSDEAFVSRILKRVVSGRLSIEEAVDLLLAEMGRGGITLMVDETSYGLVAEFKSMGYT
jgi:hypothetical protein